MQETKTIYIQPTQTKN